MLGNGQNYENSNVLIQTERIKKLQVKNEATVYAKICMK